MPELIDHVRASDLARTRKWLLEASEEQRRAAFPHLRQHLKVVLQQATTQPTLSLALLGCAPNAKQAASSVKHLHFGWSWKPGPAVVEVLAYRQVPWIGELATLMAKQLEGFGWLHYWELVSALVQAGGGQPPLTRGFTVGWIQSIRAADDSEAALRESPYTAALLPTIFEHDRMGDHLAYTFDGNGFNSALVRLANEDERVRRVLMAGCLSVLLRGGRQTDERAFAALHDQLSCPPQETAQHLGDYLGLLNSKHGAVAAMAQKALRRVDEVGLLEPETLLEVAVIVLDRPEKTMHKTQATWLRQAAKRRPERAAEFLALLEVSAPVDRVEAVVHVPVAVAAMPPPIASGAELAEELAALLAGDWSMPTAERVMAALIAQRIADPDGMRAALSPVRAAHADQLQALETPLYGVLAAALATTAGLVEPAGMMTNLLANLEFKLSSAPALRKIALSGGNLVRLLEHRLAELATAAARAPVSLLVSTPTRLNGQLDPEVAARRLQTAEEEGWQPWTIDLTQAMLRLPREVDPAALTIADGLRSPAGQAFAKFLHSGHVDPVSTPKLQRLKTNEKYGWWSGRRPEQRKVVALEPAGEVGPIVREVFQLSPMDVPQMPDWWASQWPTLSSAALPSHREVVAAFALPTLANQADSDSGRNAAGLLPLLAECEGPCGPAVTLALVYGLTAHQLSDRVAAVDALIAFGPAVEGDEIGRELGEACAAGALTLSRAAAALRQAADAGAVAMVWQICRSALPLLLAEEKPRPGCADLLEVAQLCASALGVRGPIAEVTARAQRGGSSKLALHARKLAETLRV